MLRCIIDPLLLSSMLDEPATDGQLHFDAHTAVLRNCLTLQRSAQPSAPAQEESFASAAQEEATPA